MWSSALTFTLEVCAGVFLRHSVDQHLDHGGGISSLSPLLPSADCAHGPSPTSPQSLAFVLFTQTIVAKLPEEEMHIACAMFVENTFFPRM